MQIEKNTHTITIKDTNANAISFLEKVTAEYSNFKVHNLVLDISEDQNVTLENVMAFLGLSNKHKKAKNSKKIVARFHSFCDGNIAVQDP